MLKYNRYSVLKLKKLLFSKKNDREIEFSLSENSTIYLIVLRNTRKELKKLETFRLLYCFNKR